MPQTVQPTDGQLAVRPRGRVHRFTLDGLHRATATPELQVLQLVFLTHPAAVALWLRLTVTVPPQVVPPAPRRAHGGEGVGCGALRAKHGQALVGIQGPGGEPAHGGGVQVLVMAADGGVGRGADIRVPVAALGFLAGGEVVVEVSLCLHLVVVVVVVVRI